MKQSQCRTNRNNTAFLYVRLSRDDQQEGDSYSITNQKKLLTKIAKEKGYQKLITFSDDGISGVTMDRPGLQEMMAAIEKGYGAAVFVKDLSRLGRNYLEVGRLTEEIFPHHEIRFVSVSDNIDTDEGENELAPIRNLFNEWYARDISKKRRISNKIKGSSGDPLSLPPYGYLCDPENPKRWIVDEEAASVVRRTYNLVLEGYGTAQIAARLSKERILRPIAYWKSKGIHRPTNACKDADPCRWAESTVYKMLKLQEYCGDIINFKTYSKSYKMKKRLQNAPEHQMVFRDVHTPIIPRTLWEQVQEKRKRKVVKQPLKSGEDNMFAGLLFCADCGGSLNFHFNQKNPSIKYYNCSNNNSCQKTCPTTHYIRLDFLQQVILAEVRRLSQFARHYEDVFREAVMQHAKENAEADHRAQKCNLRSLQQRDKELDDIFEKLYEDNVSGKISDERFAKMSQSYEMEQAELAKHKAELLEALEAYTEETMTTEMFRAMVQKYTRIRKLTPQILHALIEKIEVYHTEKIDGQNAQRLNIHYNCVGSLEIPDILPAPEISLNTRRGVELHYASRQIDPQLK